MKAVCILGSPRSNGNTATILKEITNTLSGNGIDVRNYNLGEMKINYCVGCRTCETTGNCIQNDDMYRIIADIYESDIVIMASPSYWGDVTGQMKVFIDRCTPYGNTNPHRLPVPVGKTGVAVVIRAGQNKKENETLISTIEHFLGHLDIPLKYKFTAEGISTEQDLKNNPAILENAAVLGKQIVDDLQINIV